MQTKPQKLQRFYSLLNLIGLVGIGTYLSGEESDGKRQMFVLVFSWLIFAIGVFLASGDFESAISFIYIGVGLYALDWGWGLYSIGKVIGRNV